MPSIYHFIVVVWLNINNCPKDTVYNATFKEYNNINRGMINVINIALMIYTYPNFRVFMVNIAQFKFHDGFIQFFLVSGNSGKLGNDGNVGNGGNLGSGPKKSGLLSFFCTSSLNT